MYMRVVAALLVLVGAALVVELALARAAIRQQSAAVATRVHMVEGTAVPAMGPPDESDAVLDRIVPAVDIPKTSLEKALHSFADQAGVRLTVETESLATQSEDPVEAHLAKVAIRDALSSILRQVEPAPPFSAEDQLIVVGTEKMETRVYDLGPLLPRDVIGASSEKQAAMNALCDQLVNIITGTISPEEWWEGGGKGLATQWNGMLVVHETPRVHRQVSRLLGQLASPQFPALSVTRPSSDPSIWRVPSSVGPAADADAILERVVPTIDIPPSPLSQAIQAFSRQTGINVVVQDGVIEDAKVQTSFEAHLHDVKVVDALRAILQPMDPPPQFCVHGDGLLVGSMGVPYVKIYDVRPLLVPAGVAPPAADAKDAENLRQSIIRCADPDTWAENGGTGEIRYWNGMFLIEQTALRHHDVAALLIEMTRTTAKLGNSSPSPAR